MTQPTLFFGTPLKKIKQIGKTKNEWLKLINVQFFLNIKIIAKTSSYIVKTKGVHMVTILHKSV